MADSTTPTATSSASAQPDEAEKPTTERASVPSSDAFKKYISSQWADRPDVAPKPREQTPFAAARRAALSQKFPGKRLILPAGAPKVRSNDTDYIYRAHSAFSHLTGWGSDSVADSVLVLEPTASGHDATLYFREAAGRDSDEFYANAAIGEFWTGPRPSLEHVATDLGVATAHLDAFTAVIDSVDADTLVLREADSDITDQIDGRRLLAADTESLETDGDDDLAREVSEMRFIKDSYEIGQMRQAIAATHQGFDDIMGDFATAIAHERGERVIEGTFNRRARIEGNGLGYETIAASGPHACILHWTRNDGPVSAGDLMLIDAGIELDSLYTADITRTVPVSGTFTEPQRRVYEAVREAADAAFAIVRPGIRFRDVHAEAMRVIAEKTAEWGLLPVSAEESQKPEHGYHRRYMVHGTSHHLGLDVHDCAQARRELYSDGVIEAGMIFTIEPGLYFQPDDLTVPEELRGIGVRIEDDILVTESGAENLSIAIPRTADDVEAWLAGR